MTRLATCGFSLSLLLLASTVDAHRRGSPPPRRPARAATGHPPAATDGPTGAGATLAPRNRYEQHAGWRALATGTRAAARRAGLARPERQDAFDRAIADAFTALGVHGATPSTRVVEAVIELRDQFLAAEADVADGEGRREITTGERGALIATYLRPGRAPLSVEVWPREQRGHIELRTPRLSAVRRVSWRRDDALPSWAPGGGGTAGRTVKVSRAGRTQRSEITETERDGVTTGEASSWVEREDERPWKTRVSYTVGDHGEPTAERRSAGHDDDSRDVIGGR